MNEIIETIKKYINENYKDVMYAHIYLKDSGGIMFTIHQGKRKYELTLYPGDPMILVRNRRKPNSGDKLGGKLGIGAITTFKHLNLADPDFLERLLKVVVLDSSIGKN